MDKYVMYTHTHILIHNETLLSHKNKWNIIYSNMDRPGDYHTKWNKWKKDKYYMTLLICLYKKYTIYANELIYKVEIDSQRKQAYSCFFLPKGITGWEGVR